MSHNPSQHPVNIKVQEYKDGIISQSECIAFIERAFRPLFMSKQKSIAKVNMDDHWTGSFWDFYLATIQDSLKSFSFKFNGNKGGNLSFIPYFQNLFNLRCNTFKLEVAKKIDHNKKHDSLDSLMENIKFGESKNRDIFDYVQHSDETLKNEVEFEESLKKVLTPKEYKIFFMKMRGRSNAYIGTKMKFSTSGEWIRKQWENVIVPKIMEHVKERKNGF